MCARYDHCHSLEIARLVLHVKPIELDDQLRSLRRRITEKRQDIGSFGKVADITNTRAFILPGDIGDGNRLRERADGKARSILSHERPGANRQQDEECSSCPDHFFFPAFSSSSLLIVLYFRSSHLNQPPLRTFTF